LRIGESEAFAFAFRAYWNHCPKRKKGRLNDKRPKSREETPKEGSDSARRYRTATICDRAAQKARVFNSFPMQISPGLRASNTWPALPFFIYIQLFRSAIWEPGQRRCRAVPDIVIGTLTKNEPLPASIRACKIPVAGPG
jgi:hypothetical protein